jgi:hypothetical protein
MASFEVTTEAVPLAITELILGGWSPYSDIGQKRVCGR